MRGVRIHERSLVLRSLAILCGVFFSSVTNVFGTETGSTTQSCNDTAMSFEDWQQWASITAEPVRSAGHSNNWVGIYVNGLAEETYRLASSPYQVCAKIIKPIYTDSSGTNIRKLTIMVKMPAGYDSENADWWYGVYDASGTDMWDEGKLQDCIICHKQAAETDYLFSKEVLNAGKE